MANSAHGAAEHWNRAYHDGDEERSWFQSQPWTSLRVFDAVGVSARESVIDVGGGTSRLVEALLTRGYSDLTVLDVSEEAIDTARDRLGGKGANVSWLVQDLLTWTPSRRCDVWHDRAVLHFFTTADQRRAYLRALAHATAEGSLAVLATFAPGGPSRCSGLPVARYDGDQLAELLGEDWRLLTSVQEEHLTPQGATQPFTWVALRRRH